MRAAQFYAAGDIRIENIPPPEPSDDSVLVEVEWCGICGSDLNEYIRGPFAIPNAKTGPHPLTNALLPVTVGHEFTGRIVQVPDSASGSVSGNTSKPLRKGQAVIVDPRIYCSACTPCSQAAATNSCEKLGFMGISGGGGGLSEVVSVRADHVHVLSEPEPSDRNGNQDGDNNDTSIDLAAAALIEPLAVAWHALEIFLSIAAAQFGLSDKNCGVDLKDVPVLVTGAGPVGVAMVFVLRARGATQIFVSETSAARREMVRETGIVSGIFDPSVDDVPERCRGETADGKGVGVVFDCAGAQAGFQAGCESLRFRGVYVNLAVPKGAPFTLPLGPFLWKDLIYKCSLAYDERDFQMTVDAFVFGRFKGVEKMITKRVILEDVVEKGFEELVKPNDHIKILATPKHANIK